jgi:phage tail-like protein
MVEFTVNPHRVDPYKNFKFRVMWDGQYVAGVNKVSGLKRSTEVVEHREGGQPSTSHKAPGQTKFDAITLERGLTFDPAFENWANLVWQLNASPESTPASFRKDIAIELYNEAGQLIFRYLVYRCWVSEYQALPCLDANATAVAIESIKLENEGWRRDPDVTEPKEPGSN